MSSEWVWPDLQLRIRVAFREIGADPNSIYPRLRFNFEFTNSGKSDTILDFLYLDLSVRSKSGPLFYLGRPVPIKPTETLSPGIAYTFNFFLTLDHLGLNRLEKLRDGGDLIMSASVGLAAEQSQMVMGQAQPSILGQQVQQRAIQTKRVVSPFPVELQFRIPKSDWVEQVLPNVGFSDVALLEIPKTDQSAVC